MADRIFTEEQSAAIAERNKTLLISAAAGSGKTATLTERIIASLTDSASPADISRMLVVTFTRAAASELRERIEAAMQKALRSDPKNRRLSEQLLLLPTAKICTIDSFCSDVVRASAVKIGISPSFRVPDEAEGLLLQKATMEDLISDGYDGALPFITSDEFIAFCEDITGVRNDRELADILLSVYERTTGFSEGCRALVRYAELRRTAAEAPVFETPFGRHMLSRCRDFLAHYTKALQELIPYFEGENESYGALITRDLVALTSFENAISEGYTAAYHFVKDKLFDVTDFPSIRKNKAAEAPTLHAVHNRMRADYSEICELCFTYSADEYANAMRRAARFSDTLAALLLLFDERYGEEKRRRALCDYADLERYALRLLVKDGSPTPLARDMARAYDYIYIDEYQDTNSMQHDIFTAISRSNNRFMVGDVKQSIYSFRNAEPTIFAGMKRALPPLAAAPDADAASLTLSQNFRCDREVIDFTNAIFDKVFGVAGESIAYREADRLFHGKKGSENGVPVTVALFPSNKSELAALFPAEAEGDTNDADAGFDLEVRYVASEISRLLREETKNDGTPITAGDIAVILRSARADAPLFAEAIRRYGIPAEAEDDRDFFLNPEILLMLSLLTVIDNPEKEIPLAACLRSPLYGFTMDDLIRMRRAAPKGASLFEALEGYTEADPTNEKCAFFLGELRRFRDMAEGVPVDKLIYRLYTETGICSLADNGEKENGKKNLLLLYDYARRFEGSSFRGLYHFISFIQELIAEGETMPKEKDDAAGDAVRIMTVHHSKGLEFPVCFLARAGRDYNDNVKKQPLIFSPDFGVATRFRDESGLALLDNPARRLSLDRILETEREEEMRLLYVALTRARERLYVTAKTPNRAKLSNFLDGVALDRRFFSRYLAKNFKDYISMILATVSEQESFVRILTPYAEMLPTETAAPEASEAASRPLPTIDELRARFDFVYPFRAVSELPGKLSVSKLYPTVLDENEDAADLLLPVAGAVETENGKTADTAEAEDGRKDELLPRFMTGDIPVSGSRRGTATHLFMQFCDFALLEEHGGEAELQRLLTRGFLTKEDADIVYLDEVEAFRRSPLFRALLSAKKVYRETRFHAGLPAAAFTADEERRQALKDELLFTQGVIDCIYETDTGYVLVDYKTDRPTAAERKNTALFRKTLAERHRLQLSYYAAAASRIFGMPPESVVIYSLPLGDTVPVRVMPIE